MTVTFTGSTAGIWGEPYTPWRTSVYSITDENGGEGNRLDWGTPTAESFSNYVQYDGGSFTGELNRFFEVGQLTYRNGTVQSLSSFDGDFPLTVILEFGDDIPTTTSVATTDNSVSETSLIFPPDVYPPFPPFPPIEPPIYNGGIFDFLFNIVNTPNETGDPVLDGDRLRFSNAGLSRQFFIYEGREYTLELMGFSTDGGLTQVGQFNSPEESVAEATLYGRITRATSDVVSNDLLFNLRTLTARAGIGAANQEFALAEVSAGNDAIALPAPTAMTAPGGVLAGSGDDLITGSNGDDVINGNQGNDTLSGLEGNDLLRGGKGNDLLDGGPGDDIVAGNRGDDWVAGGDGNDFIRGGMGNDTLDGGAGNDVLMGGAGTDFYIGGLGADVFILEVDPAPTGVDMITDFDGGAGDRIAVICTDVNQVGLTRVDDQQDGIANTWVVDLGTGQILAEVLNRVPEEMGAIICILPDDPILAIS